MKIGRGVRAQRRDRVCALFDAMLRKELGGILRLCRCGFRP